MALALPAVSSAPRPCPRSLEGVGPAPLRRWPDLRPLQAVAPVRRPPGVRSGGLGLALLTVSALLMAALLTAPEGAADQAAICQRHNGEAACRVW